jgi:hypothetical protein
MHDRITGIIQMRVADRHYMGDLRSSAAFDLHIMVDTEVIEAQYLDHLGLMITSVSTRNE